MSKPSNPFEIILKNKFFPDGLQEIDVYNYWMKNKNEILGNLKNSKAILYIATGSKTVVRRNETEDKPIIIKPNKYDKFINGRTIGILKVFDDSSDFGIVDIDSPKESEEISSDSNFNQVKDVAAKVYDYFARLFKCQILYTGKNGFHIICHFTSKMKMDRIRDILKTHIEGSPLKEYYSKRNERTPNIDLSPNKNNGGFILPGSLNKIGLPSCLLDRKDLDNFRREDLVKSVKND